MIQIDKLMQAIFGVEGWEREFGLIPAIPERLPTEEVVDEVLSTLTLRERFVLEHRFGDPPMTLKAVGEIYPRADGGIGVITERVHQVEATALRKLRHPSRSRILQGRR